MKVSYLISIIVFFYSALASSFTLKRQIHCLVSFRILNTFKETQYGWMNESGHSLLCLSINATSRQEGQLFGESTNQIAPPSPFFFPSFSHSTCNTFTRGRAENYKNGEGLKMQQWRTHQLVAVHRDDGQSQTLSMCALHCYSDNQC